MASSPLTTMITSKIECIISTGYFLLKKDLKKIYLVLVYES